MKLHTIPYVSINGKRLVYQLTHRILGMEIDSSTSDNRDISRQIRGLYFRGNMLLRKFSACSYEVKRQLFVSYCTGMYCAQLWSQYNADQLQKLRVAYNNTFRRLFKLPSRCSASNMFLQNNIPTFDMIMRRTIYSLERRLVRSDNTVLQALVTSGYRHSSSKLQQVWNSHLRL